MYYLNYFNLNRWRFKSSSTRIESHASYCPRRLDPIEIGIAMAYEAMICVRVPAYIDKLDSYQITH